MNNLCHAIIISLTVNNSDAVESVLAIALNHIIIDCFDYFGVQARPGNLLKKCLMILDRKTSNKTLSYFTATDFFC